MLYGIVERCTQNFVENSSEERPLGRKFEDNIKKSFKGI
jgi:hypothetical protein